MSCNNKTWKYNNKSSQFLFEKIKLKLSSVLKPDNNSVFSGVFIKV